MIELLNCDCMEYMAGLPDKVFDLAIVDPPYAVDASDGSFGNRGKDSKTSNLKHYANADVVPDASYFYELFRVSKNQIIWGANYYPEHLKHSGWIVWHKKTCGPLSDCELAYQSFNKLVKYYHHEWFGFVKGKNKSDVGRVHPNQKPVSLYEWLIANYAEPGQRILDTHLGSGSSAIAAYNLGFEFVGMELDADYYAAAVKRFEQHKAQGKLFDVDDYDRVTRDYQERLL